jgi:cysteinyl-tRNA synthetase
MSHKAQTAKQNSQNSLTLHNTLGDELQEFDTLKNTNTVRMYNCGPTVYDRQHIGNLRAYVFVDVLRRTLEMAGFSVTQVLNITDVGHLVSDGDIGEDKMTKGLRREGLPVSLDGMKRLGEKYEKIFKDDLKKLNITTPEHFPKASEHIDEDIAFVELIEAKGYAYETSDGIYFDTKKLDDYGKLAGGIPPDEPTENRVENSEKKSSRDFAIWKKDQKLGWDSPWGRGFPGWHIECSVMAREYLSTPFDIHTGGIDHIPVHHTNEIAQTRAATGDEMANFWLHNNFLQIKEEKISKSLGNTIYLEDITAEGFDPLAYRLELLGAHYRSEISFSWDTLDSAQTSLQRLRSFAQAGDPSAGSVADEYLTDFQAALYDDLNTAEALAVVWNLAGSDLSADDISATLAKCDEVLGLKLFKPKDETVIPEDIKDLLAKRQTARENENYKKADKLREQIENEGFQIRDTDEGQEIVKS